MRFEWNEDKNRLNLIKHGEPMKKVSGRIAKEIEVLRHMKDEDIDLTDIPETADWSKAVVGKFYRPIKKQLTTRADAEARRRPVLKRKRRLI